jgi:DNA repair protein SbcC/Rad50
MIIRKVILNPFGAVGNREFDFAEGLNVLLGPNEAGKSTLVNAIFAALFIPPDVRRTKEDWSGFLQHYLPHPNGDTIRVSLDITAKNNHMISYTCAWGSAKGARLVLEDGTEINDQDAIKEYLDQLLLFGKSTYREVLFARQYEINQTFLRLRDNKEANESVSGLLRAAVFESGGVSLEKLETRIFQEHDRLLSNWELDIDGPRGGKGINNPHINKVGAILSAYYKTEDIKRKIRNIDADEQEISRLSGSVEELDREGLSIADDLRNFEKLEDDIRKRSKLEPELKTLKTNDKDFMRVIKEWPIVQNEAETVTKSIENSNKKIAQTEAEIERIELSAKNLELRKLLNQAIPLKTDLDGKKLALAGCSAVSKKDIVFLEQLERKEAELKATASAMKLKATLNSKDNISVKVTAGFEEPQSIDVSKEVTINGEGQLLVESTEWSIDIQAGEVNFQELKQKIAESRDAYRDKLDEMNFADFDAAKEMLVKRTQLETELGAAENRLNDMLGTLNYDELKATIDESGEEENLRDIKVVGEELSNLKIEKVKEDGKLEQFRLKLDEWVEQYESLDAVTEQMADVKQRIKEIETQLAALALLPEQYTDSEIFISDLKKMRNRSSELKEQRMEVKEKLLELQKKMPEETTEELAVELGLSENKLTKLKREGRAISLVSKEFEKLKSELDTDTYTPLQEKFAHYLPKATNNHYKLSALESVAPANIISAENKSMPVELLSAGTTSGAALALRLSLAEYLLQDSKGFMIMNDPLVHLDPDRRKTAAAMIADFANEKQIIITTCDPQTAILLGGNVIELKVT